MNFQTNLNKADGPDSQTKMTWVEFKRDDRYMTYLTRLKYSFAKKIC